jgi:cell division protein ZapA (FtsZ GTPase activity inhibitor)
MSQEPQKASVTVVIAGEAYTIRSGAAPAYTRECAAYVDRTIHGIMEQSSLIEAHKASILAALSLTDQLFQVRAQLDAVRREVQRLTGQLGETVEAALATDDLASLP